MQYSKHTKLLEQMSCIDIVHVKHLYSESFGPKQQLFRITIDIVYALS